VLTSALSALVPSRIEVRLLIVQSMIATSPNRWLRWRSRSRI
jgi:hypothetical protein